MRGQLSQCLSVKDPLQMPARLVFDPRRKIGRARLWAPGLEAVRDRAMRLLGLVTAALSAGGIEHWLTYGALLGMVRDGALIAHDNDIDIAIAGHPDPRRIAELLEAVGVVEYQLNLVDGRPANHKFQYGGVEFDLYYVDRDGAYFRDWWPIDRHSAASATHLALPLTDLDCGGFVIPAPRDREAYLQHLYGPDWRRPDPNWDWRLSPASTTIYMHWRSVLRLAKAKLRLWLRRRAGP